jgi:hypothetical protein
MFGTGPCFGETLEFNYSRPEIYWKNHMKEADKMYGIILLT